MSGRPDGEYKYIVHARDHFTRFSWATALSHIRRGFPFSNIYAVWVSYNFAVGQWQGICGSDYS